MNFPTFCNFFGDDPRPYGAFFEFLQDSSPQILWRSREVDASEENEFLWHVMSFPQPESLCENMHKPIILKSNFHSCFFSAFFTSVRDIEARGFCRFLSFVFAAECESVVVDSMFLHQLEIVLLFDSLLLRANARFGSEIEIYISAIDELLSNKDPSELNYDRLLAKREVLLDYRMRYPSDGRQNVELCVLTEESLLRINENLRPMKQFVGIDEHLNRISEIMTDCSSHPLYLHATVLSPRFAFPLPQGSVISTIPRKVLSNALFCIHSGRTLVLVNCTKNRGFGAQLLKSLSAMLIFRWKDDCAAFDAPPERSVLLRHSLALVPSADPAELAGFGIWKLETHEFTGVVCPEQSSFAKVLLNVLESNGSLIELELLNYLHRLKESFTRFAGMYLTQMPRMPQELRHLMDMFGLVESDTPIFRFWMLAMGNHGCRRPIALDNL